MNDSIEKIHHHTSEEKLKWFGYGEWVEEPDEIVFEYEGLKCRIERMVKQDPFAVTERMFGGFLCGYVSIPAQHPWFGKNYDEIEIHVHFGLTYGEHEKDGLFWVGFDCAHYCDVTPSMDQIYNRNLMKLREMFPESTVLNKQYRNMDFCIEQCKKMAQQIKDYNLVQESSK